MRAAPTVAEHKVMLRRKSGERVGLQVVVFRRHVVLPQGNAVDVHYPPANLDALARQADDAFDERLVRVARIAENHNVAPLYSPELVHELVDEDAFLVGQLGGHAVAFHLDGLIDESNDAQRQRGGNQQIAHPNDGKKGKEESFSQTAP